MAGPAQFFSSLFKPGGNAGVATNQNATPPGSTQPDPRNRTADQNNPNGDPRNGIPANGESQPTNTQEPISSLDAFKDLWQPNKTADGKPIQESNPLSQPLLNTDPKKLLEASRQMDFTQGIDPALVQKALGGDAEALMKVLNHSTQNAFMAASQLSTNMVEGAAKTNNSRFDSTLDDRMRRFLASQEKPSNPILSHEAVAPIVDVYKNQLLKKYPEKPASEIHAMAEQMMTNFATELLKANDKTAANNSPQTKDPFDFASWG